MSALRSVEYKDYGLTLKQALIGTANEGFNVVFRKGSVTDSFDVSAMDILLDHEIVDSFDTATNAPLAKPRCMIQCKEHEYNEHTYLAAELVIAVNRADAGRYYLDAYYQLYRHLLSKEHNDYWGQFGLLVMATQLGNVRDGKDVADSLVDRVLLRSLGVVFMVTGVSNYGPEIR